tara:strand:+ start:1673 stop:2611 length:939 start_codon:yes stop_codon:yes gene_type:complete
MKKITIAFIGAGYMNDLHIYSFKKVKNVKIVGVVSKQNISSKILGKKHNIKFYRSIEALMISAKPNLTVVAISEPDLLKFYKNLFKFKSTFLIEKPAGYSFLEAKKIHMLAKKMKTEIYVGLNRINYNVTQKVVSDLEKKNSTRIVKVVDQENNDPKIFFSRNKKINKSWMFANSIHLIHYFNIFCRGSVNSVNSFKIHDKNKLIFISSKIIFSSGDIGIYECYWNMPGAWSVTVTTSLQKWQLKPLENLKIFSKKNKLTFTSEEQVGKNLKAGLLNQAKNLIKAFKKQKNNLVSLKESLHTMELIHKIYFK